MLLTKANRKALPELYSTETVPVANKVVQVKFFTPWSSWIWYAVEFDPDKGIFFGYVDGDFPEWGYFGLWELTEVRGPAGLKIERDRYFTPGEFKDVVKV